MRLCITLTYLVLFAFPTYSSFAAEGIVALDHVEPLTSSGKLTVGRPIRFVIRMTNNLPEKADVENGFRISSADGATWDSVTIDSIGPNVSGANKFLALFSVAAYLNTYSDGVSPDTVGFLGAGKRTKQLEELPAGYNDTCLAVTVWFSDSLSAGRHICMDSAFFGTFGVWSWVDMSLYVHTPEFRSVLGQPYQPGVDPDRYDAGYCFQIEDPNDTTPDIAILNCRVDGSALNLHVINSRPTFSWQFLDSSGAHPQTQFQIEVSSDYDWNVAEMWSSGLIAASDSSMLYGGNQLVRGSTYFLRIRAYNSLKSTPWVYGSFHMNSLPTEISLVAPDTGALAPNHPILFASASYDSEFDSLAFDFQVYEDSGSQQFQYSTGKYDPFMALATLSVVDSLKENTKFWWRARVWDGYEYSDWSSPRYFYVNGSNELPSQSSLISPPAGGASILFTNRPTFAWTTAIDPDPHDTVSYRVEIAANPNFTGVMSWSSISTPQFELPTELDYGAHYWWRIAAIDLGGLHTTSPVGQFWIWSLGDLNDSHTTDLADLSLLVAYLTGSPGIVVQPRLKADLNADCQVNLADLARLVSYLTGGSTPLLPGC